MSVTKKIYIGNSTVVEVDALRFAGTSGSYIDDAVVECTITDTSGTEISGENWPVVMDHIASSNGEYSAILPSTIGLTEGELYYLIIDVTHDDGVARWQQQVRAYNRS